MIAGGGNYSTQIAWVNGTNDQYVRFHNGTSWSAWSKQAFNQNDLTNTAWITPTLQNGWKVISGLRCAYRKALGLLFLDIHTYGGTNTSGIVIFNLPVGYRPANRSNHVPVIPALGGSGFTLPGLQVLPSGDVQIFNQLNTDFLNLTVIIPME